MKKSIFILATVTAMVVLWPSCNQIEEKGVLEFGLELSENSTLKSAIGDYNVSAALVTIMSETGELIYDKEHLPIYKFGNQYTTKSLELPMGKFQLQEFMLIDSSGVVLWATPKEGSPLAHLVRKPLPVHFGISPEQTTNLDIQVIRVKDHPPADFGYVNFDIGFVDRFCLKVFYSSRCLEEWPEGVMAPFHQPILTIVARDRVVLHEPLQAGLNHFSVPMVAEWYEVTATDCHGQIIFAEKIPLEKLLEHRCRDNFEPLMIYRDPVPGIIITPEGLREPTISQGVFGSILLPVDDATYTPNGDVVSEVDPDIYPIIRDIYFYPYSILDSVYTFAPVDCYFPADYIHMEPSAIVRTNSDGIFQAPLEEGDYLYLVKDGNHYFIDSFKSSQIPGFVKVYPGEVTELYINIYDCSMWM